MIHGYGITHEDYVWAVRSEPGVIDAFEKLYDDKDLLVSFDAINMTLPRKDAKKNTPWPHQDQDPTTPGFRCMQGLVNLLPNGPQDGGLIVCKGSHRVSQEMHEVFKDEPDKIWAWYVLHLSYNVRSANNLKDSRMVWYHQRESKMARGSKVSGMGQGLRRAR